jgi:uncharacterized protein YndB with AHSA1/START domain
MEAGYHFLDEWLVPAPVEEVFDIVGDQLAYPTWWGRVFLHAMGQKGPPRPGRRITVVARGFLPYRLHFDTVLTEVERPTKIGMALAGDFSGGGAWTFEPAEGGTRAQLDWRPSVNKPLVRHLTPVLRPLFRANHNWTMKRGQEGILRLLEERAARKAKEAG